jgi:predicted permease
VIGETALALVLLAGAGLFLRSLSNLGTVHPGFESQGVVTAMLSLPESAYPKDETRMEFFRAVTERLRNSPGVTAAAAVVPLPFSGMDGSASFAIEGRPPGPGDPGPHGFITYATPGYLSAMSIPLRRGRFFNNSDGKDTPQVAVIDENLARQYWPGEDPIGKRITNGDGKKGPWSTIVGIVGHVKNTNLAFDSGKGMYYYPMSQQVATFGALIVKAAPGAPGIPGLIRRAVNEADTGQPVHTVKSMDELLAGSLAARRFVVRLIAAFAVAALLMAALGLYGLISYSVTQRTQEIGVRMALGAQRSTVLRQVLHEGIILTAAGTGAGLLAALIAARLLQSQLYNISPFDPMTFIATSAVLLATSLVASFVPARRATRIDPMTALRYD